MAQALPQTFVQEGLITDANGRPLNGNHRVEIQLHSANQGGNLLFQEVHPMVVFVNGYYAISIGSEVALPDHAFTEAEVFLALKVDNGDWLEPRILFFITNEATLPSQLQNRVYWRNIFSIFCF